MRRILPVSAIIVALALILSGCGGGGGADHATLSVVMTDARVTGVEAVQLKITEVQLVPSDGDETGIITLPVDVSSIELLSTRDNPLTFLQSAEIPAGVYSQIRLVVDTTYPDTYVQVDGVQYELKVPSGAESGFKIKLNDAEFVEGGVYSMTLDFDAAKSILSTGHGYQLKPTVRAVLTNEAGSISGTVTDNAETPVPLEGATVTITNTADTTQVVETYTDAVGYFKANALLAGTYDVVVSMDTYTTSEAVQATVTAGADTSVGTIVLVPVS